MKNRIVQIGYTGNRRCYLSLSRDEAIPRYKEAESSYPGDEVEVPDHIVSEFEFDDWFQAYGAYGPS